METHRALALVEVPSNAAATPAADVACVLRVLGDAIRLGIPIASSVRGWARSAPADVFARALTYGAKDFHNRALADKRLIIERDEYESVRRAVAWACVPRAISHTELSGWAELTAELSRADQTISRAMSRDRVVDLLGHRAELAEEIWLSQFDPAPLEAANANDEQTAEDSLRISQLALSDVELAAFVSEGRFEKSVIHRAAANAELAEELAQLIAALRAEGEAISLVARRWEATRKKGKTRERWASPRLAQAAGWSAVVLCASLLTFVLSRSTGERVTFKGDRTPPTLRLYKKTGDEFRLFNQGGSITQMDHVSFEVFVPEPGILAIFDIDAAGAQELVACGRVANAGEFTLDANRNLIDRRSDEKMALLSFEGSGRHRLITLFSDKSRACPDSHIPKGEDWSVAETVIEVEK